MISLVIPIFNIESYLVECLNSITQQEFKDIEIIAVDGESQDSSGRILDEMSRKEPRLTVIHEGRIGPGRARNVGAERARGEYIWFVNGDDIVPAGCLALIAKRIEDTRPDVLFIGHESFYPSGKSELGSGHSLMDREAANSFTVAEQPWVICLGMTPWNKIVRREFFHAVAAAFWPDPPHEDVPVSCQLLLDAGRLSILNQVCYSYRRDRQGSITKTGPARGHFNIFNSYEAVLDQVEKRAGVGDQMITKEVRRAFFQRAIWHFITVFDTGWLDAASVGVSGLTARRDRREFFERMHCEYFRYAPPNYRRPGGLSGLKFRLIERNSYWTYSILDPVSKLSVKVSRHIRAARRQLRQR